LNVLVTGSSHGLGAALALKFAREGCGVILHGRDGKALTLISEEIESYGRPALKVKGDIQKKKTIDRLYQAARKMDINILINNAGSYYRGPAVESLGKTLESVIGTNLIAPIRLSLFVYQFFVAKGHGLIVNINSLAGKGFNDQEAIYSASKWGLRGFMGSFKHEARKNGVYVLDVFLGAMRTGMSAEKAKFLNLINPDEAASAIYRACIDYRTANVNEIEIGRRQP
jgi:short-subunit dehydrogenase